MLWVAPLLSVLIGWSVWKFGWLEASASITLGIALWTALWWIFEAVPIPVASLLPLSLLPLFGILEPKVVGEKYGHPLVLLLLGGFLLSKAMEKSGAHRRIALMMVNACPPGEKFLILGFMVATAFLSMWISNTATTLMMLPMAMAVIQNSRSEALKVPLLLGIAFAANVGGIGTPIGTPPNLVMMGAYRDLGHPELSFTEWMKFGVPVTVTMVLFIWLWLSRGITGKERIALPDPGTWRTPEVRTLLVFILTALAWITRSEPFEAGKPGSIFLKPTMRAWPSSRSSSCSACQAEKKRGSVTRLENRKQDSLGYARFGRSRPLPRGRLQAVGLKRHYRGGLFRHREFAFAYNSARDRLTRDLSDRDDQQYGDDQRPDAYSGSRRYRFGHRPHPLDDSGSHERQLRLHAPRRHHSECGGLRDG